MSGGNLNRKPAQVLINSLASGDVSLSGNILTVKQYGNPIDLSKVTKFTKVDHADGTLKVSTLEVKPFYPLNDDVPFELGFTVRRDYQFTGNPQEFYGHSKFYGHSVDGLLTAVGGYIAYLDRLEFAGEIVDQINGDPDAVVSAQLKVYLDFTGSGTLAVTDLMGNSLLTSQTLATVAAAVTALNTAFGSTVAVADSTTGLYLTVTEGLIITGESAKWDVTQSWVIVTQKAQTAPFTILYNTREFVETITTAWAKETIPIALVQQTFPILPDMTGSSPTIPISTSDYSKYIFTIEHDDAAGLTGSNRKETAEETVEFWIVKTVGDATYWADTFFYKLYTLGLYSPTTLAVTTLAATGASGVGAGTIAVTDTPGFTVSTAKFYAGASNTGTVDVSTGVVANGTDADIFYAEIKFSELSYTVVSKITCTTFVAAGVTFTGAMLTATEILAYEFLGRWDLVTGGTGLGTPVLRDFGATIETEYWSFDAAATGVCNHVTGEITTAADNADVLTSDVKYVGNSAVSAFKHIFAGGQINSQTIVSVTV